MKPINDAAFLQSEKILKAAEGEFDVLRKEWPDAPEDVYIGADPLYNV